MYVSTPLHPFHTSTHTHSIEAQTRSQERTPLLTPDLERRGRSISLPSEDRFGVIQRESSGVVDYHDDPGSASCCYKCFCCCCLWKYWIAGARASPRGCCCCRCTNCFVCGEAEDLVVSNSLSLSLSLCCCCWLEFIFFHE